MMEPDERGSASGTGSAARIPMVVLGGWLGSGKTTLLNRLLRSADAGERIAVLVNDVGEVNLDVDLVASREGDTVELTNGCVCCSIGDSLSATLRDLVLGVRPPDRVVVEASGIAEPDRVAAYGDRRRLRPDGIVVAVDATDVVARAADRICGPLVRRQVEAAEVLLVTKADLAADGGAAAVALCVEVAPVTPVLVVGPSSGDAWVTQVLGSPVSSRRQASGGTSAEPPVVRPALEIPVEARSVPLGDWVDVDRLARGLKSLRDRLGPALLRAKAVVAGTDGAPTAVHLAAGRVSIEPAPGRATGALVLIAIPGALDGVVVVDALAVGEASIP